MTRRQGLSLFRRVIALNADRYPFLSARLCSTVGKPESTKVLLGNARDHRTVTITDPAEFEAKLAEILHRN